MIEIVKKALEKILFIVFFDIKLESVSKRRKQTNINIEILTAKPRLSCLNMDFKLLMY